MKRQVVITEKQSVGEDKIYCERWTCPHCESSSIESRFNYCPECGYKIKWQWTKEK